MVGYRRHYLAGGRYFFTVTLANRQSRLLIEYIDLLREAFRQVHTQKPFEIQAIVVLPEHLHALWKMPEGDADYPGRWQAIKRLFSQKIKQHGIILPKAPEGGYRLWQRRYWEHTIRDEDDWQHHVDYIHFNPVKHSWVKRVIDWPYSSFHRYVRRGWLLPEWAGCDGAFNQGNYGE